MASANLIRPILAFGLWLVLLVVSCAPAAEPTAAPTSAPPPTSAPVVATPRPPTPTPTPAAGQPRRGGTLVGSGGAFGFASWEECCSTYGKMMNDSVLEYIPSNKFVGGDEDIRGRMAYEWSASKDGLSWTFKLEPNMKAPLPAKVGGGFEAVDCEDVAWSIMTIKTGEGLRRSMRGRTFAPVTTVDCPDPLTAVVHTKTPYGALPGMLAVSTNVIIPKGYWQNRLKELPTWVVGSGPWMLQTFIAGEIAIASPNPSYHRLAPDGKPYPYLAQVQFRDISQDACGSALRTGRIHVCGEGSFEFRRGGDTLFKEAPHLTYRGPFRVEDNPEWGSKGFLGNVAFFVQGHFGKSPWNNVKLQEALSLALDRKTLCTVGLANWCQPGAFVFVMGTPWNLPRSEVESYPGYNINTIEQNVAKARQILTEQGWALYPDSKAPSIDMPAWYDSGNYVGVPLVGMLRAAGFNVNFYVPENQRILAQVVAGEFDVVVWNQLVVQPDANQVCFEHYYTGSDRNYGRYSSAKADDLCDKIGQELDRTKRIALAHQFHKLVLDDHARATYLWLGGALAYSPDLRGLEISSNYGSPVARMENWWLTK
ncbi:MAG: ABC transporter substrate-binding protein [Chloroflexi bacterium]|nr:ABC transporter substrate-binding protein [Chloroflexota bacterium]